MDGYQTLLLRPVTIVLSSQLTIPWSSTWELGFPTICHNEIRGITVSLLTEICNNVATEPPLQLLNGVSMTACTANTDDGAHVDARARDFWNMSQEAFFDVRVFYPNASSTRHEQAKKRDYGQWIREIGHGMFTPLVLSTTGGIGREATTFYKCLADMIAQKSQHSYPAVMGWLRCRLWFSSLRSSIFLHLRQQIFPSPCLWVRDHPGNIWRMNPL